MKMNKQNTKLIAKFMGFTFHPNDTINDIKGVFRKEGYGGISIDESNPTHFKYHNSWSSLMLVIDKIESLEYECVINFRRHGQFPKNPITIIYLDLKRHGFIGDIRGEGKTSFEVTYKAVIAFIKYYNGKDGKKYIEFREQIKKK